MQKNTIVVIAIISIAVVAFAGIYGAYTVGVQKESSSPLEDSVTVAYSPFESSELFLVAEDQQFFARNGLNLTLYRSESGAAALDDMLNGKADMAVSVSEFPLVRKAFQNTTARAVAIMDKADYIYIVARKDRGIVNPQDLRGKRIGTASGSIAEFHLGRFLFTNGLEIRDVTYVSVKTPPETADDVVEGDLDAAVLAQPYADQARDRLGSNAVTWPAQNNQPLYALVVSTDGYITANPEHIVRFLRALADAEDYTNNHPAESKAIVQRRLEFDPGYMDTVWRQNQFSLSLDQSLILAMEDEARWMIRNNLTDSTAVPDFRKYLYTDGLKTVKPGAVHILG